MKHLLEAAAAARMNAYAPYSGYHVGAAVCAPNGETFGGCNVENVAYPATICAERVAITRLVAAGHRQISALALVTEDGGTPCGICLQVLNEFCPSPQMTSVFVSDSKGNVREFRLNDLLPYGFRSEEVNRTEPDVR